MIELTQDQMRAMRQPDTSPPRIVNPETHETFVLVRLAAYQRLTADEPYDDDPWTEEEMDQLRWEACRMLDSFGQDK